MAAQAVVTAVAAAAVVLAVVIAAMVVMEGDVEVSTIMSSHFFVG